MSALNLLYLLTGLNGAIAVGLGAFGAHALQSKLEAAGRLQTWQTAVQYHFFHILLLGLLLVMIKQFQEQNFDLKWLYIAYWSSFFGIFVFSGSLYTLCLTSIKWLGAITPLGGLLFIVAWLSLAIFGWKQL